MGKNKKSGVRLTPFIIMLIIIGLIIAGIIVFFYFKTIKVLKDTNVEITSFEANDGTISFNALVDGDIDYYDIYAYSEDSDNKIYIVEGANPSQEAKAYNYTFDSYGSFELYVSLAKGLFGVMDITTDKSYEEFNILYNPNEAVEGVVYDDFQVHFMTLGNASAGDSIYIKAGENDILIDAGSEESSYVTTSAYINNYCTDNKLEYVIATHGDLDHIKAFPEFCDGYEMGTIITNELTNKTTATYANMITAFTNEVSAGAKWYYAADCYNNTNGAQREYILSDSVTMSIVYNYYYFNKASDENDYSVCVLFTYTHGSDKHYFFLGGDLEAKGETKMVNYYDGSTAEKTMPHVDLYKAGHHGSRTSSNTDFLNMLRPSVCVACCCCGTNEYTTDYTTQFPTQQFINRIAIWTDAVYAPSVFNESTNTFEDLNGNIIVSCGVDSESNEACFAVAASNNLIKLKDTAWFNETIYVKNYVEATSTDNQSTSSVPHGDNSETKKTNVFYTADTPGVTAVKRRTWPTL